MGNVPIVRKKEKQLLSVRVGNIEILQDGDKERDYDILKSGYKCDWENVDDIPVLRQALQAYHDEYNMKSPRHPDEFRTAKIFHWWSMLFGFLVGAAVVSIALAVFVGASAS